MYNGREPQSAFSRFFVLLLHHLPFHSPSFFTRIFFVMSVQDSSKLRVSERNETCFNCRTEAVSHLQNAKHKITKTQKCKKVLNHFSQLTKKTHIFCSEKSKKANPFIGTALPLHSPSAMGRQKKWPPITAAIYSMYQALASISGDDKICRATVESIFFHFTSLGNGDACEAGTMRESIIPNLLY